MSQHGGADRLLDNAQQMDNAIAEPDVATIGDADTIFDANLEQRDEEYFTCSTHQKLAAKLLAMLDAWQVPNDGFCQVVEWYEEAKGLGISFADNNKTREANLCSIRRCIPQHIAA